MQRQQALVYAGTVGSRAQTSWSTSLSDDIGDTGDPSRSPRGPDSADSRLHADVIANEEKRSRAAWCLTADNRLGRRGEGPRRGK